MRRTDVRQRRARRPLPPREGGFALLIALVAVALLSILVTDLHETTGMGFAAATAERDQLKAEYLARSGVNLTRMLIGQEKTIRALIDPLYAMAMQGRKAPQIPVWQYANTLLRPFADYDAAREDADSLGFSLQTAEGLGSTGGTFEIVATSENGKINLNDPRISDVNVGHAAVAQALYSLTGGTLPAPNKYDPLFSQIDEKGRIVTRLDLVSNVIDWWDLDEQKTTYDPLLNTAPQSGGEDTDYYRAQNPAYNIKNAPFDTLEELRLVHGMSDDVWATFVEPSLDDPNARTVTIYGGLSINPNEAEPSVLISRLCTVKALQTQLLCNDPNGLEPLKFITLMTTVRAMVGRVPFFSRAQDFVDFMTGNPNGLYGRLAKLLGENSTMLFTPINLQQVPPDTVQQLRKMFTTMGNIFTIESTGRVGTVQRRIRSVINIDSKWMPPKPNAGKLPPLGIFAYYRLD